MNAVFGTGLLKPRSSMGASFAWLCVAILVARTWGIQLACRMSRRLGLEFRVTMSPSVAVAKGRRFVAVP